MSEPTKNLFDRIDDGIFWLEKLIVAAFFSVMTLVVFFDVVHRISMSPDSKLAAMWLGAGVGSDIAAGVLAPATLGLLVLGIMYAALRERWGQASGRGKALAFAAGSVVGLAIGLKLFLAAFPNGLIWSQTLGLSLMLWIGILGASMAAKERRHLALEIGSKIWPKPLKRPVKILAGVVVSLFCAVLAYLAFTLIQAEYADYDPVYRTGVFPGLALPKFAVYAVLPYGFFMIVFRYFRGNLSGEDISEADLILAQKKDQPS
jgi:TRAP-type C4-dicarboxylate transport system permease small subunit